MPGPSAKLRIAVFTGGISSERDVSLKSAAHALAHLSPAKYDVRVIEIASDATWLLDRHTPIHHTDVRDFDVALIAMHGVFAEDGGIQTLLEDIDIPYTGSGVAASTIGMHKARTHETAAARGVHSPALIELHTMPASLDSLDARIEANIHYPCIVKPASAGSSMGISIVDTRAGLETALVGAFAESGSVLVEQYVQGREVTCGVLGNSGQTALMALPVVEIITAARFFDFNAKYESTETQEICPADLTPEESKHIQESATSAHEALGCDGLTRSDFILGDDGILYFLEINTIPGMTAASICPREAAAAGISFAEFLDMQIELALKRHHRG